LQHTKPLWKSECVYKLFIVSLFVKFSCVLRCIIRSVVRTEEEATVKQICSIFRKYVSNTMKHSYGYLSPEENASLSIYVSEI
jgi:hypothetical protein